MGEHDQQKNQGGRPPAGDAKRSVNVTAKLTKAEAAQLARQIPKGTSTSAHVRRALGLEKAPAPADRTPGQ